MTALLDGLRRRMGLAADALGDVEEVRLADAVEDALALVVAEVPTAVGLAWTVDEDAIPGAVRVVVLKAARREYENPEGLRAFGVGEVSNTYATASGVYLTDDEAAAVRRAAGRSRRRAGFVGCVRTPSAYDGHAS